MNIEGHGSDKQQVQLQHLFSTVLFGYSIVIILEVAFVIIFLRQEYTCPDVYKCYTIQLSSVLMCQDIVPLFICFIAEVYV